MDSEDQDEHNQLPDVEEYKASVGHKTLSRTSRNFISLRSNRDPAEHRMDPDGIVLDQASAQYDHHQESFASTADAVPDDKHDILEQAPPLPKQEQLSESTFWKVCVFLALLFIASAIVLVVLLSTEDEALDFYHWVHGDTTTYFAVRDYVTEISELSEPDVFENASSPQFLAAQWLAHGDELKLSIPNAKDWTFDQRYALAVLYFSLGGPEWNYQLNFLSGGHVCTWFQEFQIVSNYKIHGSNVWYGVHGCKKGEDGEMYPRAISIPHNGLTGTIPDEVRGLERLEYLSLEFNDGIAGSLQSEGLSKLTSLTHLLLQKCGLTGSIPSWIGELTNLEYLGLGNNDFTGFVPSEISDLVRLELLGLEENTLSGNIELFRPLSDLKSLYLEHNYISGTISDALMLAWPNLEELYISDCALTGRLPPLFFNHPNNLKVIDLHSNQMEGPLPHEINENGKLEYLGLHENTFTGVVPESLSNFKALRHLDISSNPLISTLPEKMGELTTLEYLFAGKTDFVPSEVPEFLIRLTNLRGLSVHQNHLTGTIPSWISVLSDLEVLDLRNNHLDGGIPGQIGYLSGLRQLFLKENNLSGSIPPSFLGLSNLEVLLLEQNNFADDGDVVICSSNLSVRLFVADCGVGNGIQCSCCSACCDVGDAVCNVWESNGDLDPILEYSEIKKDYYSFVRPTGK